MKAAMIDIETLATDRRAHILSIGAVRFDPYGGSVRIADLLPGFYRAATPYQPGRTVAAETALWWMQQSEEARLHVSAPKDAQELAVVLDHLRQYLRSTEEVWSHGSTFDLPILRDAYEQVGMKCPWHYRDERDTRTIFALSKQFGASGEWPEENLLKHHPTSDAAVQAVAIAWAIAKLKGAE